MEFDERDTELISLLARLKTADREYPEELLMPQRQRYLKKLAEIGAFAGMGFTHKSSRNSSLPPMMSTLMETALIVAIVAEAGAVAFVNRDRIADLLRIISGTPKVEVFATPIELIPPPVEIYLTSTVEMSESITPASTPSGELTSPTAAKKEESVQVTSTPNPADNNGNHFGQTPKAERTKKSGNGNDPNDNDPKPTKKPKGK